MSKPVPVLTHRTKIMDNLLVVRWYKVEIKRPEPTEHFVELCSVNIKKFDFLFAKYKC